LSVLESTYTKVVDDNAVDSCAKLLWLQIFGENSDMSAEEMSIKESISHPQQNKAVNDRYVHG
jgi:hypothetical protein